MNTAEREQYAVPAVAHAGAGTRPLRSATRYLTTMLGVLSYADLAPHLATRVLKLPDVNPTPDPGEPTARRLQVPELSWVPSDGSER